MAVDIWSGSRFSISATCLGKKGHRLLWAMSFMCVMESSQQGSVAERSKALV